MAPMFGDEGVPQTRERLGDGAVLLRAFARAEAAELIAAVGKIAEAAPFRHMITPGGFTMSVAMTNCGRVGWVSERSGYRYDPVDPQTGRNWPPMPASFLDLARRAAAAGEFTDYDPDACLVNRYKPGSKLSLHQDRDEEDPWSPIVSVSLGLPAVFLWGGEKRSDPQRRILVETGDVVVWGGPSRFIYHGIAPLKPGEDPLAGPFRLNLTFRKVFRANAPRA